MTVRNDLTFDMEVSPRVITVAIPSTEITIQDLHDTVVAYEDSYEGGQYPRLILSAGKEELGGGVTVGLTATLQDAQVYFPPRSTPVSNAQTCTTANSAGRILISSGSTFQTDGLLRGDVVFNSSTGSMATILSVDSEIQLTHLPLTGGSRADWQIGDAVTTYHNPQCSISGGNLVAVDSVGGDLAPVLQAPLAQVVRTASASATLQELADIQYASFNGGVSFDETSPYAGTLYPIGTPRQPVNNVDDAYDIAVERGFTTGYIIGDLTLPTTIPLQGFTFVGSGKDRSFITVPDAADVQECTFIDAEVTGYLDGACTLRDCLVSNLNYVRGYIEQCVLQPGTITLAGNLEAHFLDCYSGVPGVGTPTIDMGGSGQALAMRNYNGGIRLTNKNGSESVSIDLNSGQVRLAANVTNGTIVVRGIGKLVDDATDEHIHTGTWNGVTIVNESMNLEEVADQVWETPVAEHVTADTFGHFIQKKLLSVADFLGLK